MATDAGGIRDAVLDDVTGLVVPDEDVFRIAGAIEKLMSDEALRKRLGEEGKRYAKMHDWSMIVGDFLKIYDQAIRT